MHKAAISLMVPMVRCLSLASLCPPSPTHLDSIPPLMNRKNIHARFHDVEKANRVPTNSQPSQPLEPPIPTLQCRRPSQHVLPHRRRMPLRWPLPQYLVRRQRMARLLYRQDMGGPRLHQIMRYRHQYVLPLPTSHVTPGDKRRMQEADTRGEP